MKYWWTSRSRVLTPKSDGFVDMAYSETDWTGLEASEDNESVLQNSIVTYILQTELYQ